MEALGSYILSVSATALICGLVTSFVPLGRGKDLVRMVCGIFMTVSIIGPFSDGIQVNLDAVFPDYISEGEQLSAAGKSMAGESAAAIINDNVRAYILDKAQAMDLKITVDISMSDDLIPVPEALVLCGDISPFQRLELESVLEESLGITKEHIQWKEWTSKEAD